MSRSYTSSPPSAFVACNGIALIFYIIKLLIMQFSLIKLKLSHYTPQRRFGGEEAKLLLILDLGTRWR
jgi:hypothetical protein